MMGIAMTESSPERGGFRIHPNACCVARMRWGPVMIMVTCLLAGVAEAAELIVIVNGIEGAEGRIRVHLYDEEGFRDEAKALAVAAEPIVGQQLSVRFVDLNPGRYAVIAYHDSNTDGRMNRFLGMIPTEGYALSNNPRLTGPPQFNQAAFELGESDLTIALRLDY
jgi:uncharacterized protein (DUF2141 family)